MSKLLGASIAALVVASAASATTFENTSLADLNGSYGAGVATTTTDASGTRTTVVGPGGGGNRASATPVATEWKQTSVGGGATVGITTNYPQSGNGSAFFNTVSSDSKADLTYLLPGSADLRSINSVSFDFFRDAASTTGTNFAPVLRLDIAKDGGFAGSLVLEYLYQNQTPPPVGAWTTLTASLTSGIFWATNSALGPTFASADGGQKTLQEWINANASSSLMVYSASIGVGSGWNGTFSGAVDNVNVSFQRAAAINSNFEVAETAAAVPEPATWAMFIGGFGLVGGSMRRRQRTIVRFA